MTFDDPRKDRTPLRLQLYHNGFTPLPNHNKACFLPEWSTVKVTPELIQSREWARSRAWADTGLRCGEIIAIDWDVNNADLINELLDEVVEKGIVKESPFVRVGKPPRELWVYRTSEKIGKRTTGGFARPEDIDNPDVKAEQVEVLGGGCQFAAYGWRDEDTQYQWPVESLLDAKYMDLPEITLAEVEALKDFAIAFFERKGLQRKSAMAGTDGGYHHVYDLTPDMVFDVQDHGEMSVAEIDGLLRAAPDMVLRCTVEAIRPGTSGSWAGMISLVHGAVCVSDHGSYTSHFPAELDDTKSLAALGRKLDRLITAFETSVAPASEKVSVTPSADETYDVIDPNIDFDTNLERALKRFVYVAQDDVYYDLMNLSELPLKPAALRNKYANVHIMKPGKMGGETLSYLIEAYTLHNRRRLASSAQMRPDRPRPLFTENGSDILNTYNPPRHAVSSGNAEPMMQMLYGLLPNKDERHYFMQWLRHKYENPHIPSVGIIMVAQGTFGTGRGTLFDILGKVFGESYVSNITFNTLIGKTTQSQYNEWMGESLIVTVNEALETDGSRWQNKVNAYEHIKEIVDPAKRKIMLTRKGYRNIQATSYASMIIATNHADSFVLPPDERRLAVLENGKPAPSEFWERLRAWAEDPTHIAAFVERILKTDMTGFNAFVAPPVTALKLDMIDSGRSELDTAIDAVFAGFPGPLVTREQLVMGLEDYARANGSEFPEGWPKFVDNIFRRTTRRLRNDERVLIEGRLRSVRVIREHDIDVNDDAAVIAAVEMNGPQARVIKTSSNVLGFPQRA